ncbi:hypothetical protein, partial [Macellibacteroides fermentans]|uniref:hypothetical protein n=1 Tax=Macellibacteroides fermentans TaxID=879969 RepID=UPI00352D4778
IMNDLVIPNVVRNLIRSLHTVCLLFYSPHSTAFRSGCLVYPDLSGPQAGMTVCLFPHSSAFRSG